MLPLLEKEVVTVKKWAEEDELLNYYAIAQTAPGIIAVNVAVFVGYKVGKFWGALCSCIGMITPSIIVITLIAGLISNFQDLVWVQKALTGINIVVSVLLVCAVYKLAKNGVKDIKRLIICLVAFIGVTFFDVSTILLIIAAGIAGYFLQYKKEKALVKEDENNA